MRKILVIFFSMAFAHSLIAQEVNEYITEHITMKDGSVLSGHVIDQTPGKKMIFKAYCSEIYIQSPDSFTLSPNEVNISELEPVWAEWAEKNQQAVHTIGDSQYITLHSIISKSAKENDIPNVIDLDSIQVLKDVKILESGHILKCLILQETDFKLSASEISEITRTPRDREMLTGMTDIIETIDGKTIEGQIVSQIPGEKFTLATDDGIKINLSAKEIAKQRRSKLNKEQDIFEQCQLLDVIETKEGDIITGIIIEQDITGKPRTLTIQDHLGVNLCKSLSSIVSLKKVINPDYLPIRDIILAEGYYMVNGIRTKASNIEEDKNSDDKITGIKIEKVNTIKLSFSQIANTLCLRFKEQDYNEFRLVKYNSKMNSLNRINFNLEELYRSEQYPSRNISPNNMVELKYNITEVGIYLLYNPESKAGIVVQVL